MEYLKKFASRKLVVSFIFGVGVPVLFKAMDISDMVTMVSLGIGTAYLGVNALVKTKGVE